MSFLDRFTKIHRPSAYQAAKNAARKREGLPAEESAKRRAPMEWPSGSLHARQTAILKWIESNGGRVDYR